MPSPAARLLVKSLLTIVCGAVACGDSNDSADANIDLLDATNGGSAGLAGGGGAGAGDAPGGSGGVTASAGVGGAGAAGQPSGGPGMGGNGGGPLTPPDHSCLSPEPILVEGAPSGMVKCADGNLARTGPTSCRLALSAEPKCEEGGVPPKQSERCFDPCLDGAFGRPRKQPPVLVGWTCDYFCASDADCPNGTLCACDATGAGKCLPGGCDGSTACGEGDGCRVSQQTSKCDLSVPVLRCLTPVDECVTNADCKTNGGGMCKAKPGEPLRCGTQGAAGCGRPILVEAIPRLAVLRSTTTWLSPS